MIPGAPQVLPFDRDGPAASTPRSSVLTSTSWAASSEWALVQQFVNLSSPSERRWVTRLLGLVTALIVSKLILVAVLLVGGDPIAAAASPFSPALHATVFLGFGLAGAWLILGGRRDPRAPTLGAVFCIVAIAFAREPGRLWATHISSLSRLPFRLLARQKFDPLLPGFLWLFARDFPHRSMTSGVRRRLVTMLTASTAWGLSCITDLTRQLSGPNVSGRWFDLGRSNDFWLVTAALSVAALAFMLARTGDTHGVERVRSAWFVVSLTVGFVPLFVEVMTEALIPGFERWAQSPHVRPMIGDVLVTCLLTIPVTTTYAVLARHVLDVRVVFRRALRCALTKYAFMVLSVAPLGRVGWLLAVHPQLTFAGLTTSSLDRLLLAAALIGLGLLTITERVLKCVDRLFFGPTYDARVVVGQAAQRMSRALDAGALAEILRDVIRASLDPCDVAVALKMVDGQGYRLLDTGTQLPDDAPLVDYLARQREEVLCVTDRLLSSISSDDAAWIARHGVELIVGVRGSAGPILGWMGLAARRNERPYQSEDIDLLGDLTAAAALALERQTVRSAGIPVMLPPSWKAAAECPGCGLVDAAGERSLCGECGSPLEMCPIPWVVSGKFLVRRRLGRGGMGVVYLAEDLALRRYVALKTLSYLSAAASQRSQGEALAMASVSHPHIATLYGCERWQDRPILVIEYLEGGTLATRLRASQPSIAAVVAWGLCLADALRCLHRRGRLHGDIKPSNIGFDTDNNPKLLDFGLTNTFTNEPTSRRSLPRAQWGTLAYRCPDADDFEASSPHGDLWSLAAVLYEAIVGPAAFQVFARSPHPRTISFNDGSHKMPAELVLFFERALSPRVEDRPARAEEFSLWLRRGRSIA